MDQHEDFSVGEGRTPDDDAALDALEGAQAQADADEADVDLAAELEQVYAAASAGADGSGPASDEGSDDPGSVEAEPAATAEAETAGSAIADAEADGGAEPTADADGEPGEDAPADGEEAADDDDLWVPGDWYVVHTYAGYENKVKVDLETRVASMNMEDSIFEVVIPMEEVMEIKSGKKTMVPRKVFPGYLLVRMDLNDDSWYVVRNTPGVTGFVGSGNKPIPLSPREVDKILARGKPGEVERPKPLAEWQANDNVRVTTGPFANFQGSVSEVDLERQKVKVLVNIFGRETPVELSFDQISKV